MFPPIWLSVHDSVELQPKAKWDYQMNKIKRPAASKSFGYTVLSRPSRTWYRMVGCKESCEEKTPALETIIKMGLYVMLPLKSKTVIANEPPWINNQLKFLIHER